MLLFALRIIGICGQIASKFLSKKNFHRRLGLFVLDVAVQLAILLVYSCEFKYLDLWDYNCYIYTTKYRTYLASRSFDYAQDKFIAGL
jgi:hypothetical protein